MTIKINIGKSAINNIYWQFKTAAQHYQIFYGGASAGKSIFIAQRAVIDLLGGRRNYLVARNVGRTSRQSTFMQIQKIINEWNISHLFEINKSDLTITCINGSQIIFVGLDDVDKLKSIVSAKGILTDIWIEEAIEISEQALLQLERRMRGRINISKRIILSFNPILKTHWIYKRFFKDVPETPNIYQDDKKLIVKVTYKDNKFLSQQDIDILENEKDKYFFDVYTLGNWGILGDVIFKNWKIEDIDSSSFDTFRYGLDFGYSQDPAAFVELAIDNKNKKIYVLNEIYSKGLTNSELADSIKIISKQNRIVCDSAEPKSIKELQILGLNTSAADKGKDSVLFGIQWLQQHEIIIDTKCQSTINEFRLYQWQKTRQGETINRPVDKYNHAIDAIRYALGLDMRGIAGIEFGTSGTKRTFTNLGGF